MGRKVTQYRGDLTRTRAAIDSGRLTVGFLGGSITDARVGYNWPEAVIAHLVDRDPAVRITVENAAIGGTGSDSAVFRADRDIVDRACDIVFVEYAVNDHGTDTLLRGRSREGVLRKLLKSGADVVIVYTFCADMHAEMSAGTVPASIAEFERLAEHYGLPSVWMGLHALHQVNAGLLRWYEWLPDNLHPQYRGSQVYADSVNAYLDAALANVGAGKSPARSLPSPLDALNWENATRVRYEDVALVGPWTIRRWPSYEWIEMSLETSAIGATLTAPFEGRVLWLGIDFGKRSADFRYRIDDDHWVEHRLDRPGWVGDAGWFRGILIAHDLGMGQHEITIETTYNAGEGSTGSDFKVGLIGFVPV